MASRRGTGARYVDEQRARIVAAATDMVADRGLAGCSVAAVAARAGVASGTVYNRFPNRTDLATEVFTVVAAGELAAFEAAARTQAPTADRMVAIVETFAARVLKAPGLSYALIVEPAHPRIAALRLQYAAAFRAVVASVIADGVRTGDLPPQDATVSAAAVVGSMTESMVDALAGRDDPAILPMLMAFVLRGVGAPLPSRTA